MRAKLIRARRLIWLTAAAVGAGGGLALGLLVEQTLK